MRLLLPALLLAGCTVHPPPPMPSPKYVVGTAYQAGGAWYYPSEDFQYDATGLAERIPSHTGLTADGEAYDPAAMAGAHQTLQLPAIARVTNLETGRQALIRINDRGPANPGRILALTPRAADLLGLPSSGAAEVRVEVQSQPSQALKDQLGGAEPAVTAAPLAAVSTENLPPPPGVAQSSRARVAASTPVAESAEAPPAMVPQRLPETVTQVPVQPGALWIAAGHFGLSALANTVKAKLYGLPAEVDPVPGTRPPEFRVRAGPFPTVAAADAALDRARAAGVTDAKLVVE